MKSSLKPKKTKTFLTVAALLIVGISGANAQTTIFNYTGNIDSYTVPTTGYYDITAFGAQGGSGYGGSSPSLGGLGAEIGGDFLLTAGEVLDIVVGGSGQNSPLSARDGSAVWMGGGGGGGSFVYFPGNSLVLVAGGGGGGGYFANGGNAQTDTGGQTTSGAGGTVGSGGGGGQYPGGNNGGGGGGWNSNGQDGGSGNTGLSGHGGQSAFSFTGGAGGTYEYNGQMFVVNGGFGGGGGAGAQYSGGGGGGYSGGGGGSGNSSGNVAGGGGGSFRTLLGIATVTTLDTDNTNQGNGMVEITPVAVPEPTVSSLLCVACAMGGLFYLRRIYTGRTQRL